MQIFPIIPHDLLPGFVANEHIDWKDATDDFLTTGTVEAETLTDGYITIDTAIINKATGDLALSGSTNAAYIFYIDDKVFWPLGDITYDLGKTDRRFLNIYGMNIYFGTKLESPDGIKIYTDGTDTIIDPDPDDAQDRTLILRNSVVDYMKMGFGSTQADISSLDIGNVFGINNAFGDWIFNTDDVLVTNSVTGGAVIIRAENTHTTGTGASGALIAKANTAYVDLLAHGDGRTATRFGETIGGWNELLAILGNGLLIGTLQADDPIILGTEAVKAMHIDGSNQNVRVLQKLKIGADADPANPLDIALATEDFDIVDAGSTAATEQDWIEVLVGGNTGYIRVYATK